MQKKYILAAAVGAGCWLTAGNVMAQHYIAGTEGIQAGTLPGPGIYLDDINLFAQDHFGAGDNRARYTTYINEPRLRWISEWKILGANYGAELMLPLEWEHSVDHVSSPPSPPNYTLNEFQPADLEISPLLLSWHLKQFDFTAGYAFWVPTDKNSLIPIGPHIYIHSSPLHWWGHMITAGGSWHPDADKKWSVSFLSRYEINQSLIDGPNKIEPNQTMTTEWGLSRMLGDYFELGFVGNYVRQVAELFDTHPTLEVGPEIKATVPKWDFSASVRYLRLLTNPDEGVGSYTENVMALTLSKRF